MLVIDYKKLLLELILILIYVAIWRHGELDMNIIHDWYISAQITVKQGECWLTEKVHYTP